MITVTQIKRRRCFRCGRRPGYSTWSICADANRLRVLCWPCDHALNRMVLKWSRDPRWAEKVAAYREAIG